MRLEVFGRGRQKKAGQYLALPQGVPLPMRYLVPVGSSRFAAFGRCREAPSPYWRPLGPQGIAAGGWAMEACDILRWLPVLPEGGWPN